MKIVLLWLASLAAVCAQDIAGTWQGSVNFNGRDARMVFKIARDNGSLSATLYNIDANPRPIPASSVTLQDSTLKIVFVPGRLEYEGKTSRDGNSITGNITLANSPSLNLTRATAATAWAIPEPPALPKLMADDARLVFEVATIKPAPPNAQGKPFTVNGNQIQIKNRSLAELIGEAYSMRQTQINGATGWMTTQYYDIFGKPEATGAPNPNQLRQMLASLLTERFHLKFHLDERELPVYVIRIGKTGQHKLTPASNPGAPSGRASLRGAGNLAVQNSNLAEIAASLQLDVLDRPVVDQTGIVGRFDFNLRWRPEDSPLNVDSLPDLFTAFEEQLGLRIEATKAPVKVLVIDGADRPSEN